MRVLAVIMTLLATPALATDLSPQTTSAPIHWAGLYAGVHAGGAFANVSSDLGSSNLNGFLGGGQIGYNYDLDQIVIGAEGDFSGSTQSGDSDQSMPWLATLRSRIGYSTGSVLFYATGGGAWVDYKILGSESVQSGWVAGVGTEWMVAPKWSIKAEYLYLGVSNASININNVSFSGQGHESIARVGLNYHF